jgi:ribosomal protein S18 acetylase RimI-like enzyme
MEKALYNLFELYRSIADCNDSVTINYFEGFAAIESSNSAWPNMIYSGSPEFLSTESQVNNFCSFNNLPQTILVNNDFVDWNLLKSKKIYPIDKWTLMVLSRGIETVNSRDEIDIFLVQDEKDLFCWCEVVSKVLFANKIIDSKLFGSNKEMDLVMAKIEDEVIATSLVFYDNQNVAGIYMVSVLPEYRRRGIGELLMNFSLKIALQKRVSEVVLQSTNAGLELYKKMGFQGSQNIIVGFKL